VEELLAERVIIVDYATICGSKRDGTDYRYRMKNGRFDRVDGEPKPGSTA
jgi:hypothetical protein